MSGELAFYLVIGCVAAIMVRHFLFKLQATRLVLEAERIKDSV